MTFYYLTIRFYCGAIVEYFLIYYFVGIIINRVGTICVEPLFKKLKIISFAPYSDFLKASEKDKKIEILSETNNMYRNILSGILIIIIAKVYIFLSTQFTFLLTYLPEIIIAFLLLIFILGYRKQTSYIKKRVDHITNKKED